MQELFRTGGNVVPEQQRVDRVTGHGGKFTRLAEQLIGHAVNSVAVVIDKDANAAPERLVHGGADVALDKFHHALRTFFHTELAHFAGCADLELCAVIVERAERADRGQRLRRLGIDKILIDFKLSHVAPPQISLRSTSRSKIPSACSAALPVMLRFSVFFSGGKIRSTWVAEPASP